MLLESGYFIQEYASNVKEEYRIIIDGNIEPAYFIKRDKLDFINNLQTSSEHVGLDKSHATAEAAGVPNYVIEDFKEMLLKKHDFSLFCIDLFITDKGEWGIFEFCPNFGVGSVPNSLCPNETKIFIERVLKRMSHMKETGNGLC